MNNPHHTLHSLLPPKSTATQHYQLRLSDNLLMIDSCQHIMDTCLTVILLHDYILYTDIY